MQLTNKRILLLTDSLALPRKTPELCIYNDTYPVLLREAGFELERLSIGGALSFQLYQQASYYNTFNPDIVIVQSGIVDCAPRFMKKIELDLCSRFPRIGNKIIRFMNKQWVRELRKITYTPIEQYQWSIKNIEQQFTNSDVYFIGILPASEAYEKILPGIKKNIALYNDVLSKHKGWISMNDIPPNGIMSDGHHLNKIGHQYIFEKISERITQ